MFLWQSMNYALIARTLRSMLAERQRKARRARH
jgi:hypothetical protein